MIGSIVSIQANKTIKELSQSEEYFDQIAVVVLSESTISSVEDIGNYQVGVQRNLQTDLMLAAEGKISKDFGAKLMVVEYNTIVEQVYALLSQKVDAVIYNSAYEDLLIEQIDSYKDKTKTIYTFDLTAEDIDLYKKLAQYDTTLPSVEKEEQNDEHEQIKQTNDNVFAVYLSGMDTYGSITQNSRSDVNIIAVVNKTQKHILLITTPRDFYVKIPGISSDKRDKLTHAGIYGIDASMSALGELYDINLDYYLRVNFSSFEDIIDALGGLDVYICTRKK